MNKATYNDAEITKFLSGQNPGTRFLLKERPKRTANTGHTPCQRYNYKFPSPLLVEVATDNAGNKQLKQATSNTPMLGRSITPERIIKGSICQATKTLSFARTAGVFAILTGLVLIALFAKTPSLFTRDLGCGIAGLITLMQIRTHKQVDPTLCESTQNA